MDREITILHQKISRLVSESEKIAQEDQGVVDFDRFTESEWRRLAARIDIRVKGTGAPRLSAC